MSLLHLESFDRATSAQLVTNKWLSSASGQISYAFVTGRTGNCIKITNTTSTTGAFRFLFDQTINTNLVIGFATKRLGQSNGTEFSIGSTTIGTGSSKNMTLFNAGDGTLQLRTGGTTVRKTRNYNPQIWNYYEIKLTTHDTTGTCVVKENNKEIFNYTGDTKTGTDNSTCATWDARAFTTEEVYIDDFYMCDGNGSVNNNFLGPIRIETLYSNGDGATINFTPSAGGGNYLLVDDDSVDGDSTYVEDDVVSNKDLYNITNLGSSAIGTIAGIQVNAYVRLDSAGSKGLKHVARSSATESDSSEITINITTYKEQSSIYEQDPNAASAWVESTVNAAQFGVKVST